MQGTENATMLLGRVLLSLLFLIGGTIKLLGPAATQAMFVKQGLPNGGSGLDLGGRS
jgi:uncharacterized membrane protein YphA (DoxX/SURF4 family)